MDQIRNTLAPVAVVIAAAIPLVAINVVRETHAASPTIAASTAHFNRNNIYLLSPANGSGEFRCKVLEVDGAWLRCDDPKLQWVNTNTMMYAKDSR
jgi:hypothetical protein